MNNKDLGRMLGRVGALIEKGEFKKAQQILVGFEKKTGRHPAAGLVKSVATDLWLAIDEVEWWQSMPKRKRQ